MTRDHVIVWVADLEEPGMPELVVRGGLDAEEWQAAGRFQREEDQRRFLRRRAFRRRVLADAVGVDPGDLRFQTGPLGKPELIHPSAGLTFSASQSKGWAMVAVGTRVELGVDLERHVPLAAELPRLLETLAGQEREEIGRLDPTRQQDAFFAVWTRKEAVLKAAGCGLHFSLDAFAVPSALRAPAGWVRLGADGASWWLQSLSVGTGVSAALASLAPVAVELRRFTAGPGVPAVVPA